MVKRKTILRKPVNITTDMPVTRYLKIRFANRLYREEIPRFRAAVIEATQRESDLFHNHTEAGGFRYRYPLIQYKTERGCAVMVCLNEGADDIHYLLRNHQLDLRIGQREETLEIEDLYLNEIEVGPCERPRTYRLTNWQCLNQDNHRRFVEAEHDESAQVELLQRLLANHLLGFAEGIGWRVEERLAPHITTLECMRTLPFKGQHILTFDLSFTAPLLLPDSIGLGKGSSVGFGVIRRERPRRNVDNDNAIPLETQTTP